MARGCSGAVRVLVVLGGLGLAAGRAGAQAPEGWFSGADVEAGADRETTHGGKAAGFLASKGDEADKWGPMTQSFLADDYRGKRVRLSGYLKAEAIDGWAGLWMRVDTATKSPSFDNMMDRPIKGTNGWQKYEIVLDVPDQAEGISLGFLLIGKGKVWADDLKLEIVDNDVATTKDVNDDAPEFPAQFQETLRKAVEKMRAEKRTKPANLDFER